MATIIEFHAHCPKSAPAGYRRATSATAEVVVFPGVRYERMSEVTPAKARRRRRRERLDLEE
jgi:hypothetical protein